jgi:FKBP-type peptidyl-prolyl cis-trans isomerase 2
MAVKKGDKVKVDYTGTFEDGTVFDSSEKHGQPLEFEVGAGQMIEGFDKAVVGMNKGEEKEITINPEEAYGRHNPELMKKIPRQVIKGMDQEPKEGMMLGLAAPDGRQFAVKIAKVEENEITIDLNHPLAGKTLKFKLKLVEVV